MQKRNLFAGIALVFSAFAVKAQPGSLDPSFDADGKVTTHVSTQNYATALAIAPDGRIVVTGYVYSNLKNSVAVLRYNTDGALDGGFGNGGKRITAIGQGNARGQAIALQADGRIVVAGYSDQGSNKDFTLVRYQPDGTPDSTFDQDGVATTTIGAGDDQASAVAIQPDGKIVVAGTSYLTPTHGVFALARYNSDGSLDATFGTGGIITTAIGTADDQAQAMALQADGKIVVAGFSKNNTDYDFALLRYQSDGSLDPAFNAIGIKTNAIGMMDDFGQAMLIQPDGKIVVSGYSVNPNSSRSFALARYETNGALDSSFGSNGIKSQLYNGIKDQYFSLALQADGKIVAAGHIYNAPYESYDVVVARYNTTGQPDNTFSSNAGLVTTSFGAGDDKAFAVAIQPDGKIVAAGSSRQGPGDDIALARYIPGPVVGLTSPAVFDGVLVVYPNPAREQLVLTYSLQQAAQVSIRLFDNQGRLIKTLLPVEKQGPGRQETTLMLPAGLAAGPYTLCVEAAGSSTAVSVFVH